MIEKDYQRYLKQVIRKLQTAHIPAVARETGLSDANLRRIKELDSKNPEVRPNEGTMWSLIDYFEL